MPWKERFVRELQSRSITASEQDLPDEPQTTRTRWGRSPTGGGHAVRPAGRLRVCRVGNRQELHTARTERSDAGRPTGQRRTRWA